MSFGAVDFPLLTVCTPSSGCPVYCYVAVILKLLFLFAFFIHTLLSLSENYGRLTWVWLQQAQEQRYPVLQVHSGSFRVSVIHRTLTWTTGSLTCVRDHSYACASYTRALGTPTASMHNIVYSEKLSQLFIVLLTGLEPRVFESRVRRSTN